MKSEIIEVLTETLAWIIIIAWIYYSWTTFVAFVAGAICQLYYKDIVKFLDNNTDNNKNKNNNNKNNDNKDDDDDLMSNL